MLLYSLFIVCTYTKKLHNTGNVQGCKYNRKKKKKMCEKKMTNATDSIKGRRDKIKSAEISQSLIKYNI